MNRLRRRIELLEKRIISRPIELDLPDGSTRTLSGHPSYVLELMMRSFQENEVPELDLIAHSVGSVEPRGAHMIDVARLLHVARRKSSVAEDTHIE